MSVKPCPQRDLVMAMIADRLLYPRSELVTLHTVQEVNRLANGNTAIRNWAGSPPLAEWLDSVQVVEVTPDKKVVWALRDWKNLGPASSI